MSIAWAVALCMVAAFIAAAWEAYKMHHYAKGLRAVLGAAALQFEDYERLHRAKGTAEALEKAVTNRNMAAMCRYAMETP